MTERKGFARIPKGFRITPGNAPHTTPEETDFLLAFMGQTENDGPIAGQISFIEWVIKNKFFSRRRNDILWRGVSGHLANLIIIEERPDLFHRWRALRRLNLND